MGSAMAAQNRETGSNARTKASADAPKANAGRPQGGRKVGAELTRETVWFRAWLAVASSTSCAESDTATAWADECLSAFDVRFPRTEPMSTNGRTKGTIEQRSKESKIPEAVFLESIALMARQSLCQETYDMFCQVHDRLVDIRRLPLPKLL